MDRASDEVVHAGLPTAVVHLDRNRAVHFQSSGASHAARAIFEPQRQRLRIERGPSRVKTAVHRRAQLEWQLERNRRLERRERQALPREPDVAARARATERDMGLPGQLAAGQANHQRVDVDRARPPRRRRLDRDVAQSSPRQPVACKRERDGRFARRSVQRSGERDRSGRRTGHVDPLRREREIDRSATCHYEARIAEERTDATVELQTGARHPKLNIVKREAGTVVAETAGHPLERGLPSPLAESGRAIEPEQSGA